MASFLDRFRRGAAESGDAAPQLKTDLSQAQFFTTPADPRDSKVSERYRDFFWQARKQKLAEIEQIVPYYEMPLGMPVATRAALERDDAASAGALLKDFPPKVWGYYQQLSKDWGTLGRTDKLGPPMQLSRQRSEYRLNFIMNGLELAMGAGLDGLSVVDIACNWGGFAVEARLRGASEVVGFDIREENTAKAARLAQHFGLDDIGFHTADLFAYDPGRTFDVVLNLGLMYHISQPFEMMKKTFELSNRAAVIDTVVHREAVSGFILGTGEMATDHAATAIGVELHPTYRALIDLAYMVGFRQVIEIHGLPDPSWEKFANEPYGNKTRRCIVALK